MKKKILSSVLIFMFAWVAVGTLDCGCAFASPIETTVHQETDKTSEDMDCHGSEEAQSKKSEEACCSGCKLESKASIPPSIVLTGPTLHKLSDIGFDIFTKNRNTILQIIDAVFRLDNDTIDRDDTIVRETTN